MPFPCVVCSDGSHGIGSLFYRSAVPMAIVLLYRVRLARFGLTTIPARVRVERPWAAQVADVRSFCALRLWIGRHCGPRPRAAYTRLVRVGISVPALLLRP